MRIVFMGTPQAAVPSLEALVREGHDVLAVYTQPDRPAGRGNKLHSPPVKLKALELDLEVRQPQKIRTAEAIEAFRSLSADVAVVVAYGRILPVEYLKAFPHGAINVHFSLLPKYRGAAPVNWAIVNGETVTGVTTMQMDEGLDTGYILRQTETPIGPEENAVELMERLSVVGADLLLETIRDLDSISPRQQDHELATFAPILKKENGIVDWTSKAEDIAKRVRGFQPFPTTYTYLDGKKVTFWTAVRDASKHIETTPGTVIDAMGDRFAIACGNGTVLEVRELQLEGKRRMSVRDFLNGMKLEIGARFTAK